MESSRAGLTHVAPCGGACDGPRAHAAAPYLPPAARSIQKGSSLAQLLDRPAIEALIHNISLVYKAFDARSFRREALRGLAALAILQRGLHLAGALRTHLPRRYEAAIDILLRSLTPPTRPGDDLGLAVFFYLPHVSFVAQYGWNKAENGGRDSFRASMRAQYELTRRFSAEFSMRQFLIHHPERTLRQLQQWTRDADHHVRRLCSEGARPRLPWAVRIPAFIKDPAPLLPILEALKDDPELYVRRSVANHLGDIAKDHPDLVFRLCRRWLQGASRERKWLIRHALRHPAKKGVATALKLRKLAK